MVSVSTTFWIQLLGMVFGVTMLYFSFVKYKRKEILGSEFLFWAIGWGLLIFVAIVPGIIDFMIAPLHFYRRLDFFVVLGFFVLLSLGFYNYSIVRRLEQRLEKYVRKDAIENPYKK